MTITLTITFGITEGSGGVTLPFISPMQQQNACASRYKHVILNVLVADVIRFSPISNGTLALLPKN